MSTRRRSAGILAALVTVGFALGATGVLAQAGAKPKPELGAGRGHGKITLCHKGRVTIRVGAPALNAHLRHGDRPGACSAPLPVQPGPNQAVLVVFKYVINDSGGTKTPADFTITVSGVPVVGSSSFPGSASGVAKIVLGAGSYSVGEGTVPGYALASASAGCAGTIAPGQEKTCLLVNNDLPS